MRQNATDRVCCRAPPLDADPRRRNGLHRPGCTESRVTNGGVLMCAVRLRLPNVLPQRLRRRRGCRKWRLLPGRLRRRRRHHQVSSPMRYFCTNRAARARWRREWPSGGGMPRDSLPHPSDPLPVEFRGGRLGWDWVLTGVVCCVSRLPLCVLGSATNINAMGLMSS